MLKEINNNSAVIYKITLFTRQIFQTFKQMNQLNKFINYLELFQVNILNIQSIAPQTCNFDHIYLDLCHDNNLNKNIFYFNIFDKEKQYFLYLFFVLFLQRFIFNSFKKMSFLFKSV